MATHDLVVAQALGSFGGGGAQRLAYNLASALRPRVTRSLGIVLRERGEYDEPDGPEVLDLSSERRGRLAGARLILALRRLLISERVDVLHVHGSRSLPLCAAACAGLSRTRLFFTWHDSGSVGVSGALSSRAMRWALRRCAGVFGSSSDVCRRLREFCPRITPIVFVNGVPVSEIASRRDDPPLIVWTGRIVPTKGPLEALHAAAALRDARAQFRLVLAGDAPKRNQDFVDLVRRERDDLALASVVDMPGWVENPGSLYARAWIGLQTSHSEGLSMSVLEMMMAGLCVVATDVGDTRRAIIHERTGMLIPPRDEGALREALMRVLTDHALRESLASAARAHALAQFSLSAMADRALNAYAGSAGVKVSPVGSAA